ncbi:MAG: BlaI/MecI/CopY family transcriptional regulator [Victivallales bacterium]|nr:BlaI/MecI/CopY family transcriptional regulator [Victivallales bacterium]
MNKKRPKLTAAEFAVMEAVWKSGEATVTAIMNYVNTDNDRSLARSTIQMQLFRLEDKGWLQRREVGNKFYFSATVPREDAQAMIAANVRRTFFGGSCAELVKALFSSTTTISPEEVDELRRLIKTMGGEK